MDSILSSIKKLRGIDESYTHFDADIITNINTSFSILTQLGVGPTEGFAITDSSAVWSDFIGESPKLSMVKSYVDKKVQMMFDPPTNGAVKEAMNASLSELEWRISVAVDPGES